VPSVRWVVAAAVVEALVGCWRSDKRAEPRKTKASNTPRNTACMFAVGLSLDEHRQRLRHSRKDACPPERIVADIR
jgi:hypothetical protein